MQAVNTLMRYAAVWLLLMSLASGSAAASNGWSSGQVLSWNSTQIEQVVTFGLTGGALLRGRSVSIEGRQCLEGGDLHFRVSDAFAFDTDENVQLEAELYAGTDDAKLSVIYDGVKSPSEVEHIVISRRELNGPWQRQTIPLRLVRFANLGYEGADFSLIPDDPNRRFTVCDISIRRSYATPLRRVFGGVAIEVFDESDQLTPARVGIYDASGRMPLPSDEALLLKNRRAGANRVIGLNGATRELPTWPVANRSVFYIDGRYYTRLPVGEYELVVGKGPEYRIVKQRVVVAADQTNAVKIKVHRWRDMAAQGWYSGDTHIHYPRASEYDDYILQKLIRAEDLKVANILTYGNGVNIYLSPYSWRPDPLDTDNAPYVLVAGQEDPRTSLLGHSVELNIREPVRDPARYLLYDSVFASIRAQGGLVGYAHAVGRPDVDWYLDPKGLAIDVPAGLVDFVEIMAPGITGTSIWFDFLNLGYKLAPTAGTDSPYASVLGAVRSYVQLNTSFSRDAWFEALRQGRTFASSGPMLEFSVNGNGIGSQLQAHAGEVLVIDAKASINPDIGTLASLELIEQGAVVRKVTSRGGELAMELRHKVSAKHGTWLVLRAQGKNPALNAISAPIYVLVDGQSFWKPSAVPAIVAGLKSKMQEALKPNQTEPNWECESPWPTAANNWNEQMSALEKRISKATALYDALARSAKTAVARH